MGLLDLFNRNRSKPRPVGQNLERGPRTGRGPVRRKVLVKTGIIGALTLLTLLAFTREGFYEYTVQVGDTWRRETLVAPFDFAIFKAEEQLREEREAIREREPPYFRDVPDAQARLTANRDTVAQQLDRVFSAYESYLFNRSRGRMAEAVQDSIRYQNLRRTARPKLNGQQWELLLEDMVARVPELSPSREVLQGTPLAERLLTDAWEFGASLIQQGVLNIARDSIYTDEIIIRNQQELTERRRNKDNVYGLNESYQAAQNYFQREYSEENAAFVPITTALLRSIFVPSLEYMRGESMAAWQREASRISPTRGKVSRGEVIVQEGETITEEVKRRLTSLERAQAQRSGPTIFWREALGQLLLTLATFAIFFLYLFMVRRTIFDDNRKILLIAILFAVIIGLFAIVVRIPGMAGYVVPVAVVSVLLTVMFDSRVGLFGTLTLALVGGLLQGYDFEYSFATLFAGTLGVFSVRDIKNRGQFFLSAGLVWVGYVITLVATWLFFNFSADRLGETLLMTGISSFLLILAYPLLWVFERAFDITTDLTLLELSDTNRPLLKELSLRAPGTFNHSLQVANLAEAAAAAIGANALLTRVGALYHDIGKMLKPEYFVENQRPGDNPHDHLKPRMSALIIASHVKEGLEMGRQYNLPRRVLDFIPMHHGTTRIEYFFRKAQEERSPEEPEVMESEFRYPGPRPASKETGILMLADGVEAASRSLNDPTHKRLEALIDVIINARVEDEQLDDTELTFRDLKKIKETFLSLLLGIYHVRVKYPGQDATQQKADQAQRAADEEQAATTSVEKRKVPTGGGPAAQLVDAGDGVQSETPVLPDKNTDDENTPVSATEANPSPVSHSSGEDAGESSKNGAADSDRTSDVQQRKQSTNAPEAPADEKVDPHSDEPPPRQS